MTVLAFTDYAFVTPDALMSKVITVADFANPRNVATFAAVIVRTAICWLIYYDFSATA
jgi:hypothetical protein